MNSDVNAEKSLSNLIYGNGWVEVERGRKKCCRLLLITPIIVFKGIQPGKESKIPDGGWGREIFSQSLLLSALKWKLLLLCISSSGRHLNCRGITIIIIIFLHLNRPSPGFDDTKRKENIIWSAQPCLKFNELFVYPSKDTSLLCSVSGEEVKCKCIVPTSLSLYGIIIS